jgi:hypothetical protein
MPEEDLYTCYKRSNPLIRYSYIPTKVDRFYQNNVINWATSSVYSKGEIRQLLLRRKEDGWMEKEESEMNKTMRDSFGWAETPTHQYEQGGLFFPV